MNTMAAYKQHVIVRTGKDDWTSRIEDEEGDAGAFVRGLKGVSGKGGKAFDVCSFPFQIPYLHVPTFNCCSGG